MSKPASQRRKGRACNETKSEERRKKGGEDPEDEREMRMNGTRPRGNQGNCFIIIRAMQDERKTEKDRGKGLV